LGVVKSYTHIWLAKHWYGAGTSSQGLSAQYAYIDGRIPVSIDYIFQVSITHDGCQFTLTIAIVCRFRADAETSQMEFPWLLWYDHPNLQASSA
jgi:hypothetical protein